MQSFGQTHIRKTQPWLPTPPPADRDDKDLAYVLLLKFIT